MDNVFSDDKRGGFKYVQESFSIEYITVTASWYFQGVRIRLLLKLRPSSKRGVTLHV